MGSIYHELTDEELNKQLDEAKSELRELRFTYAVARSLPDPSKVGNIKRNVARILTVKKARELKIADIKPKTERKKKGSKDKKSK